MPQRLRLVSSVSILRAGLGAEYSLEADRAEAAAGDPEALVRLAERYETADGVPFDLRATSAILELAAERGHAEAQYRLGLLQAGGLDPEADPAEAYGWLQLAAQSAQDAPIGLLARAMSEALAGRLDKEAIERAEQQVAAFRPATGPAEPLDDRRAAHARTMIRPRCWRCCRGPAVAPPRFSAERMAAWCSWPMRRPARWRTAITPGVRADLARRGAALDVAELSPAICAIRDVAATSEIEGPASGVSLAGIADDGPAMLRDGDKLVIDVAAASEPRYVAIDYVVHTGEVWHLYPNAGDDGYLPAGQSLRLGDGADGFAWEVGAPFGEDLVLVTLSSLPFASDQPGAEPADAFRARLQQRLQAASGGSLRLFAQVVAIEAR